MAGRAPDTPHSDAPPASCVVGSITHLKDENAQAHVCTGSHGGRVVAQCALAAGVSSLICHNAGVGLEDAGIQGLAVLDAFHVPAAAVDHMSARIGDPHDMLARGVISHVNRPARDLGLRPGVRCEEAFRHLQSRAPVRSATAREEVKVEPFGQYPVATDGPDRPETSLQAVALDSASSIGARDTGRLVFTGSHGGLPGGSDENAIKAQVRFAVFNDAGVGIENAGISRLPALDRLGVAAAAVDAASARIGDGRSTYETGFLSHVNDRARELGAVAGMPARDLMHVLAGRSGTGKMR